MFILLKNRLFLKKHQKPATPTLSIILVQLNPDLVRQIMYLYLVRQTTKAHHKSHLNQPKTSKLWNTFKRDMQKLHKIRFSALVNLVRRLIRLPTYQSTRNYRELWEK